MNSDNHQMRMQRVRQALVGVRVGDAFGQAFFIPENERLEMVEGRKLPGAPWHFTDDTVMSLAVAQILELHGEIKQDELADLFARQYATDPLRAYGGSVQALLRGITEGEDWRKLSREQFDGMGSWGNGAAMRSAVVGAYFAGDAEKVKDRATLQAEITHAHEDGIGGAVAVALASAMAASQGELRLDELAYNVPFLQRAAGLSLHTQVSHAAQILGNGEELRAADTVPLALWVAARHWNDFESAMWALVSVGGDRDTTCAIAGGVMAAGGADIPESWLERTEPLP